METRPKSKRWRRLERSQVLLAAVVAAVASIIVALVTQSGGQRGAPAPAPAPSPNPVVTTATTVIAIMGLSEQPSSAPPGLRCMWNGSAQNLPYAAEVLVIDKPSSTVAATGQGAASSQSWLVSPQALVSKNGTWTVIWIIANPQPSAVTWSAVVQITSDTGCPQPSTSGGQCGGVVVPPAGLSYVGPKAPGVETPESWRQQPITLRPTRLRFQPRPETRLGVKRSALRRRGMPCA
jgi:hypothetical protein